MRGIEGDISAPGERKTAWRTRMLVVMAVSGAAVLFALTLTLGEANRQRDRALRLQSHSYEVMILARTLSSTIAQSEASLGRYVISTDKQLGRLYSEEWKKAGNLIGKLDRVTRDNGVQNQSVAQLLEAYDARGSELSDTALSTNYGKNDMALKRFYRAGTAVSLVRINELLDRIIAQERSLLDQRTSSAMQSAERSNRSAAVLAVFGMLIVFGAIVLGWLTVNALGERAAARAEADQERERSHELQSAVERATNELRKQESKLRQVQKMEAVGQLTGGIAHDFNNMLAVVLGGLELAKRSLDKDPEAAPRHIDNAMEGANRAAALTRQLLAFSREETLKLEPIAAGELITGMSDLLDRTLGDAITVEARDRGREWLTCADRHQLENVILNLAVNARDAMKGRGRLTIVTAGTHLAEHAVGRCPAGQYVTIAVTDTGHGMTPEVMERVFEPFFTTKPIGQGTGLGLSQIFAFVRQAQGEIGLQSRPGKGTTVTLYLPRHIAQPQEIADSPAPLPDVRPATALDILVVEDDPRVLTATMGALEDLGHRPIACNDPREAPAMLATAGPVDLIVSDVLMPGQTGPELIAEVTQDYPQVAVLFVTGYAGEAGGEAEFGGHHVLRKPFTIAGLERAVGMAMAAERPAPESLRPLPIDSVAAE
ncbi:response regulator [Sphingomonas aliaeris]|uniref:histidine kinase n=1 Tax=Sphingomonas aliaeris TaxID=2759526 RepID=A0A974S5R1_9SPHN|nr:ATP-binding protein [Sphingomonas aliaeris]QQV78325.1 response regulator [Sphingomonas aliaeris]